MKCVYLIQSKETGHYKIGISKNPKKRIQQLNTGNSSKLKLIHVFETEYPFKLETALHNRYSHIIKYGEWFDFDPFIEVNFLKECELLNRGISHLKKNLNPFV